MLKRYIWAAVAALLGACLYLGPPRLVTYQIQAQGGSSSACRWTLEGIQCSRVAVTKSPKWGSVVLTNAEVLVRWDLSKVLLSGQAVVEVTGKPSRESGTAAGTPLPEIRDLNLLVKSHGVQITLRHVQLAKTLTWQAGAWEAAWKVPLHGTIGPGYGDLRGKTASVSTLTLEADWQVPGTASPLAGSAEGVSILAGPEMALTVDRASLNQVGSATEIQTSWVAGAGEVTLRPEIRHPWLTLDPGLVKVQYRDGQLSVTSALGSATLTKEALSVEATCASASQALGLQDPFEGTLSFDLTTGPKPELKLKSSCKLSCQAPRFQGLHSQVTYQAYHPDGVTRFPRTTGPRTASWYPLESLPEGMAQWWVRMEDPGFWHHSGVLAVALEASLRQNLQEGRFARGGSTITMQLVRNLWLARDKNLTRKGQEILLSWALEKCLTKEEILAWYLNVVEFGPDQYGIQAGSYYHYGVPPPLLEPLEGFYLATIMPNPKRAPKGQGSLDVAAKRARRYVQSGWLPADSLVTLGIQEAGEAEQEVADE